MSVLHNVVRGAQDGTHVPLKVSYLKVAINPATGDCQNHPKIP